MTKPNPLETTVGTSPDWMTERLQVLDQSVLLAAWPRVLLAASQARRVSKVQEAAYEAADSTPSDTEYEVERAEA